MLIFNERRAISIKQRGIGQQGNKSMMAARVLVPPGSRGLSSELLAAVCCLVALLQGCNGSSPNQAITETQYELADILTQPPYWIDNARVLFSGIKVSEREAAIASVKLNPDTLQPNIYHLHLWDDSTRTAQRYADPERVCLAQGVVRYIVRVDKAAGQQVVKEGPFGAEQEIVEPLFAPAGDERWNYLGKV